ncbi:hypothetical protein RLPCCGM1_c1289 [Rhizobium leguminosarum bv. phaseoli CCGM1]|uniref:Rieske 2Fe-2S domain-containing protein n=1 Tax=Rhizobium phaseoli TaxID=396 RepID=UPI0004D8F286|nr:Rieske 2Fe-2S domain-containing protein [Rhizobium phaseoli]KEC73173.1 hypothetical protein RLPCCGM1_c1289 [Rhizobium leguminosarum bv. phaseoli CCGM1]PWI54142.1 hypothetical protein B5K03_11920 [Rhizobium phaseoli]
MKRLDELTQHVEVGRYYLVPTVTASWCGDEKVWPVIGPQHNDRHCLDFGYDHYHIDPRFVAEGAGAGFWLRVSAAPIMTSAAINAGGLPKPVWRRRICRRLANPDLAEVGERAARHPNWQCHFDEWTGKQAKRDSRGWICPHRAVSLADHAPVDGVITCPLHLLRINAETGVVLPPIWGAHGNA